MSISGGGWPDASVNGLFQPTAKMGWQPNFSIQKGCLIQIENSKALSSSLKE
jgi:hypothetical protein